MIIGAIDHACCAEFSSPGGSRRFDIGDDRGLQLDGEIGIGKKYGQIGVTREFSNSINFNIVGNRQSLYVH